MIEQIVVKKFLSSLEKYKAIQYGRRIPLPETRRRLACLFSLNKHEGRKFLYSLHNKGVLHVNNKGVRINAIQNRRRMS